MTKSIAPETQPFDIEVLPGVTFTVAPISDFDWLVFKGTAARVLDDLSGSLETLDHVGLTYIADYDHANEVHRKALYQLVLVREIAKAKIIGWNGIVDDKDQPAPVSQEGIEALMKDWVIAGKFYELVSVNQVAQALAKKKLSIGAAGISGQAPG
jgi:hypothetical protein